MSNIENGNMPQADSDRKIKKITVVSYNPDWPLIFEREASKIKEAIGSDCLAIYHIGSTSVPGLSAKPVIDVIGVVKNPRKAIFPLESLSFKYKGEYNIPMRLYFNRSEEIKSNLHVYEEGHPEIELNLLFRDYLRQHPNARDEYGKLKEDLLKEKSSYEKNNSLFTGYNLGKDEFIRKILQQANFNRTRIMKCTHYAEWKAAKQLRNKYFFAPLSISDPYTWTFDHPEHAFKNANHGYLSLRGFNDDKTLAFKPQSFLFNDSQILNSTVRLVNLTARTPKAVCCTPIATFNVPDKATEEMIANGIAISVDFDHLDPLKSREVLENILEPATLIIASGGQWQDDLTGDLKPKLHMHWRLKNPTLNCEDHERLKQVRKKASQISSGDLSASSPAHPMRIPGSWHTKAEPKLCRILECREDVEISLEVAEVALGIKCSSKSVSKFSLLDKGHKNSGNTDYGLAALEKELLELSQAFEGNRNNCLNKASFCLGQLVIGGELDQNIVFSRLLTAATEIGLSESEARSTISSGMRKGMTHPRNHKNGSRVISASSSRPDNISMPKLRTGAEIRSLNIKIEWLIDGLYRKMPLLFSLAAEVSVRLPWLCKCAVRLPLDISP